MRGSRFGLHADHRCRWTRRGQPYAGHRSRSALARTRENHCRQSARADDRRTREARRLDRGRLAPRYLQAGNIWVTCEPYEPILPGAINMLGDDLIMFASDYPHWDGEWPDSTKHLRTRSDISDESREKIGGLNAQRFYALN
ncbi:amidohydrolase family protein [Mycobacterium basiliense]|uniref:amidohydrolase family protein n=1 Tax=Mycobacterium basiliense TaxID=2094119 RepID=UPI001E5E02CC|nr:amidohydrolase family protein [Mycobacterium basiliense]